ncbi:polyketide synthase [Colletotrichum tofieldiae]|nr:polyketide synthase [Colletotrichum tofieldiae]GKT68636.1 polyketide synthase [Colletotrichum tofieldiae]
MPHEYLQPHLIHPTTLDGALQVCLVPLVSNPAKKQKSPIVLSFMEELWVSASQHPEDGYQVFADSSAHGRKQHLMSCTAVDSNSKEPMIRVSGCIVTEVDGADESTAAHDPRQRAWNIDCKPDPDFLSAEKAQKVFQEAARFHKYLDALAHKNPSMKILDVSNGSNTLTKNILSTLDQRYAQYDFTASSTSFLDEAQTSISEEGHVQFKVVDLKTELASQGLELATYDVLLAPVKSIPNADIEGVIRRFLSLLKPKGKLILTAAQSAAVAKIWASADDEVLAAVETTVTGKRLLSVNKEESLDAAFVTGFAASIRLERPEIELIIVTSQSQENANTVAETILEIDARISASKELNETAYKVIDGTVTLPRLVEAPAVTKHIQQTPNNDISEVAFGADLSRPLRLQIQHVGLLSSLRFTDNHLYATPLEELEVEFQTMATAVNSKDLAVMLGKTQETPVGLEAAGIVTRVVSGVTRFKPGDRVFGFTFNGAYATYSRGAEGTLAKVPDNQSFAEVAVIPIVYTTAYACLYDIGDLNKRVRRGQKPTVLIHAAAGGVGQAAIQLAQHEGVEIFATVGSLEKRDFLEKTYGLPRDHIFSSRDLTFKEGVKRMTGWRGVDIVINSLSGDALRATWEIVAPFGSFAEIGLSEIESRSRISMGTFARGVTFESLELNYMRKTDSGRLDDLFARDMESVLGQDLKRATPITKYPLSKIQDAMRFMQSGKHIGKILVECNPDDVVQVVERSRPATKFAPDATYVVSGGFGGLGQEVIRWMVKQGASNLIVTSRKGPVDETAKALIVELQSNRVKVATPCCDITDKKALEQAISSALSSMLPVRGCTQASTVLRDNVFGSMTADEWHGAINVKVTGSSNLWEVLTSQNPSSTLDFFVMLSSLTGVTGNNGQSNYSAGNAYQNAMAKHLSTQGHNVVALNAPVMRDAGIVAVRPMLKEYLLSIGWAYMSVGELINALDYHCRPANPTQGTETRAKAAQDIPMLWLPRYSAEDGAEQPTWQHEPMYNHLVLQDSQGGNSLPGRQGSGKRSTADLIAASESPEDAENIVLNALLEQLSKIRSYELVDLDPSRPMHAYGVDSLVAVELRVWMTKEIGADISVFEMTSGQRIAQLSAKAAATSRFLPIKGE